MGKNLLKRLNNGNGQTRHLWLMIVVLSGLGNMVNGQSPAEEVIQLDRPLVIAHRGYPAVAPENTLPGFELGKLTGADLVELDYHVSKDGVAMVIHDSTLDRTTDAVANWGKEDLKVSSKTAKEMEALDAGSWYGEGYTGTELPTLDMALDVIQADGGITLIERKGGDAEHIVALLGRQELVNEVIVQSFDWEFITAVHEQMPEQVLGAIGPPKTLNGKKLSTRERDLNKGWIDEAKKTGAHLLVWNSQVDKGDIAYAHKKGFKVCVYTINEIEKAQILLGMGVDGIITNNTGLIWKAIALQEE